MLGITASYGDDFEVEIDGEVDDCDDMTMVKMSAMKTFAMI
jgi:hypothetical protein